MTRSFGVLLGLILLLGCLGGACAHRADGDLDVDQVQSYVNAVEKHLKGMRYALRKKNLDAADDEFTEASEIMIEHRSALAAYPEMSELESEVAQAEQELCYQSVNLALQGFFDQVRKKDMDEAQDRLEHARAEHKRCREKISRREDYPPLQMNLDSAPESLVELEKTLARPALLKKIAEAKVELEELRQGISSKLASLEKKPNQKELAVAVHSQIKTLAQKLDKQPAFGGEAVWVEYLNALRAELAQADSKRQALVRRGKVVMALKTLMPVAEQKVVLAAAAKDRTAAREMLVQSKKTYREVGSMMKSVVAEEKSLTKQLFPFKGKSRTLSWLMKHVAQKGRAVERMIARIDRKPLPKKQTVTPAAEKKKKKKKKKRRKRRIRRW